MQRYKYILGNRRINSSNKIREKNDIIRKINNAQYTGLQNSESQFTESKQ